MLMFGDYVNCLNTIRVMRNLRDFYSSSSEIYGDPQPQNIPTNENYRGNVSSVGLRSYDESKRMGETLCYIFMKEYFTNINRKAIYNYGPGLRIGDKRLPADFYGVVNKKDMIIYSDGKPTRTFCYISDAIIYYLKALHFKDFDYFNIGIDNPELSVTQYAELFAHNAKLLFNYSPDIIFHNNSDKEYLKDNPNRRCPDISKARRILEFNPLIKPSEGIRRYLTFLKETL